MVLEFILRRVEEGRCWIELIATFDPLAVLDISRIKFSCKDVAAEFPALPQPVTSP